MSYVAIFGGTAENVRPARMARRWASRSAGVGELRIDRAGDLDEVAEVEQIACAEPHRVDGSDGVGDVALGEAVAAEADHDDDPRLEAGGLDRANRLDRGVPIARLVHEPEERIVPRLEADVDPPQAALGEAAVVALGLQSAGEAVDEGVYTASFRVELPLEHVEQVVETSDGHGERVGRAQEDRPPAQPHRRADVGAHLLDVLIELERGPDVIRLVVEVAERARGERAAPRGLDDEREVLVGREDADRKVHAREPLGVGPRRLRCEPRAHEQRRPCLDAPHVLRLRRPAAPSRLHRVVDALERGRRPVHDGVGAGRVRPVPVPARFVLPLVQHAAAEPAAVRVSVAPERVEPPGAIARGDRAARPGALEAHGDRLEAHAGRERHAPGGAPDVNGWLRLGVGPGGPARRQRGAGRGGRLRARAAPGLGWLAGHLPPIEALTGGASRAALPAVMW